MSEFYFQFLKLGMGQAPLTLQSRNEIAKVFDDNKNYLLINLFEFLPNNRTLINDVPSYMPKYNLLPNDAIILASCKIHGITKLASHDSDFVLPCQAEGIQLLTEQ